MDTPSDPAIEGQLLAHRKVIGLILAALDEGARERVVARLRENILPQDHQEDPLSEPSAMSAIQGNLSLEIDHILQAADRHSTTGP